MDSTSFVLTTDGGGYWSGLIVPIVIIMVGLVTAAVVLLISREPAQIGPANQTRQDEHADESKDDD